MKGRSEERRQRLALRKVMPGFTKSRSERQSLPKTSPPHAGSGLKGGMAGCWN
jgi:hypothetical protein